MTARALTPEGLQRLIRAVLGQAGAPDDLAGLVANVLVDNQLTGHDSHGLVRLVQYVAAIEAGAIDPKARPRVIEETPTTALISGEWGFGQPAAIEAVEHLVDKAQGQGVASVSVVRGNHTGRLAAFTERAARRGVVAFMTLGTLGKELMAPFGGRAPAFGTNPVCFSFPNPEGDHPVTLDYATSAIANGKLMVAKAEGKAVPEGVVAASDGAPTTDVDDFLDGGFLLPFGGHKGYALAVVAELFGSVVAAPERFDERKRPHSGVFLFGIRHDAFLPAERYARTTASILERIRSVPTISGQEQIQLPGDPEARNRADRSQTGMPIGDGVWRSVREVAARYGVDVDVAVDGASE